jgi:hypothetical protein
MRLAFWLVCLGLWTWALLVPDPGQLLRDLFRQPDAEGSGDGGYSSPLLDFILSDPFWDSVHVIGYAVLTILAGWLKAPPRGRWLLVALLLLHAMLTEYLQDFVPTRWSSWEDLGFDFLGIGLGMALSYRYWFGPARVCTA